MAWWRSSSQSAGLSCRSSCCCLHRPSPNSAPPTAFSGWTPEHSPPDNKRRQVPMNIDLQAREIKPLRNTYAHVAKYIGDDKPASRYQEATYGAQPSANFHYRPTWDPEHEIFDASRSAIVLADWYVLKDPRQFYYATWTMTRARQQDAMESNFQFVETRG